MDCKKDMDDKKSSKKMRPKGSMKSALKMKLAKMFSAVKK